MVVVERPLAQRIVNTVTPLNLLICVVLCAVGMGLSRLLVAPRFGFTLMVVAVAMIFPLAAFVIARPRFGVQLLFVVSVLIIGVKRLDWSIEVGVLIEFLEGVLVLALALSVITRRDAWRFSSPLTPFILLYLPYQVIIAFHPSLPTTYNMIYALREPLDNFVPFFAAVYLVRDRQQLRSFLYLWLGLAAFIALYGLKQYYLGLFYWEADWLAVNPTHLVYNQLRIFSTLGSADALGMHMAVSIVIALGVAFYTSNPKIRLVALALIPIFVVTNLYTLTRGAYLAVLVGVLALALITRHRAMLLGLVVAAALVLGWYQVNQDSLLVARVMTMFSPEEDESYTVRTGYLQQYLPVILNRPFGFGPATSGRQGGVLLASAGVDADPTSSLAGVPTDNYYFRIALENGWVGCLLFILLLVAVIGFGIKVYLTAGDPLIKWVAPAFVAAYVAMAVSSWSNNYFSHPQLKLFFWFSLGVLSNLPLIERSEERPAGRMPSMSRRLAGAMQWS